MPAIATSRNLSMDAAGLIGRGSGAGRSTIMDAAAVRTFTSTLTAAEVASLISSAVGNYLPLSGGTLTGDLRVNNGVIGRYRGPTNSGVFFYDTSFYLTDESGKTRLMSDVSSVKLASDEKFGFSSGVNADTSIDTPAVRDSPGCFAFRNATTAQKIKITKTWTSSTICEDLEIGFTGTNYDFVSRVGSAGGSNQPLRVGHVAADGTTFAGMTVATSGEIVSHANGGLTIWKTPDQVTNFGKINIAHTTSSNTAIAKYDLLGGGTIAVGWHAFYVGGVSRLEIDAVSALSYGNLYFSADNTKDIGRVSTAAFRPRSVYVGTSVQIGMPANTPIVGALQVGGTITASGVTIAPESGGCRVVMVPIDGSSDTYIDSTVTGDSTKRWAFGIDNSANKFCIAKNASGSGTPFGSADLFTIDSTGNTTVGGALYVGSNVQLFPFNGTAYSTYVANGTGLSFFGASGASGYGFSVSGNTVTLTTGVRTEFAMRRTFAPTSGTATFTQILMQPTINQTGGANGISRGLWINPDITAAADWRSLDVSAGKSVLQALEATTITASGNLTLQNSTTAVIAEFSKTFTSSTNREYAQIGFSGVNYDFVSRVGSAGGSSQPIRVGHLAADGTTFAGLTVATSGAVTCGAITASGAITTSGNLTMSSDAAQLLISGGASRNIGGTTRKIHVESTTGSPAASLAMIRNSADNFGPSVYFGKSRTSSYGANTAVNSGDILGLIAWVGADGSQLGNPACRIAGEAQGTFSGSSIPADITFSTCPSGSTTAVERLRVASTGAITASGNLTYVPATSSITLGTNGQFAIEMTSNTAGNLVYRGSDGTTRRMALTFN